MDEDDGRTVVFPFVSSGGVPWCAFCTVKVAPTGGTRETKKKKKASTDRAAPRVCAVADLPDGTEELRNAGSFIRERPKTEKDGARGILGARHRSTKEVSRPL